MKVAVITPYYREDMQTLLRCVNSVKDQTYKDVKHIMVADGYPADIYPDIHITIPCSGDSGNTPRGVGSLVAMAQDCDAIALLDADCWMEPNHIETMVLKMQATDAAVVTCPRNLYRVDGTFMCVDQESDGVKWNDTNCFLIRKDVFRVLDGWMFGSKGEAYVQDRFFWERIKSSGVAVVRTDDPTVNYPTTIAGHYLANKEAPPEGAKVVVREGNTYKLVPYKDFKEIRVEIHTLVWPDSDSHLVAAHTDTCKHLGINVTYTLDKLPHGEWMNAVMQNSTADVVGFLDCDCVPLTRQVVDDAVSYCMQTHSMVGIAQASNHIPPKSHIFAAPAFFFIWRETWEKMNKPTFSETNIADVGENVSYAAELADLRYKTLFPLYYTREPVEGVWHLHTFGKYGIGTVFEGGVYHLYQGRLKTNVDLFVDVCKAIREGTFSVQGLIPCR